jgi:heat shock protein HslJ
MRRWATVLAVVLLAGCGTPAPSLPPGSPAVVDAPAELPAGPAIALDGTAWRAERLGSGVVPPIVAPELWFDEQGRGIGTGFTGCEQFGWTASFADGRVQVGELQVFDEGCAEPGGSVEKAFLAAFRATDRYEIAGDSLLLRGEAGETLLVRQAPPIDDASRPTFDRLRAGTWEILAAPGVTQPWALIHIRFADRELIGAGPCGYSGRVRFGAGGRVQIEEVGWDTFGCEGWGLDERPLLRDALQSVSSLAAGPDGTVVLQARAGDVVLGR